MDVVELTRRMCSIPSITGEEGPLVEYISRLLKQHGFQISLQSVGQARGRANMLATVGKPVKILLSTHLDTVPPFFPPELSHDGLKLRGRGTCDAKGIAAAMICALVQLRSKGEERVGLLFLVGEEADSDGAKAAADGFAPEVDFVIHGEPTELKLVSGMKGCIAFDLETTGKLGHSAYPELGESAIHILVEDIYRMTSYAWPSTEAFGQTTLNFGVIKGGEAANVIASCARATGVFRVAVDAEKSTQQSERIGESQHRDYHPLSKPA